MYRKMDLYFLLVDKYIKTLSESETLTHCPSPFWKHLDVAKETMLFCLTNDLSPTLRWRFLILLEWICHWVTLVVLFMLLCCPSLWLSSSLTCQPRSPWSMVKCGQIENVSGFVSKKLKIRISKWADPVLFTEIRPEARLDKKHDNGETARW